MADRPRLHVVGSDDHAVHIVVATSPIDRLNAWSNMAADPEATARSFRIAAVIAAHASSKTGFGYPSIDTFVAETGINRRDVQRELRRLEDHGWIVTRRGGGAGKSSSYALAKTAGKTPAFDDETAGGTAGKRAGDLTQKGRVEQRVKYPPEPENQDSNQLTRKPSVRVCPQGGSTHNERKSPDRRSESRSASPDTASPDEDATLSGGRAPARRPAQDGGARPHLPDLDFVMSEFAMGYSATDPCPWRRVSPGHWERVPDVKAEHDTIEQAYRQQIAWTCSHWSETYEGEISPALVRKAIKAVGPKRANEICDAANDADDRAAYIIAATRMAKGNGAAKPRKPDHEDRLVELNRTYREMASRAEADPTPENLRLKDEAWQAFQKAMG